MSNLVVSSEELHVPGGVGFVDAKGLIEAAAEELEFGTILSVDGFGLNEAMSAVEIMDARMDSGMADPPPPFNPNMLLLPSELCWIIDRSFACEMAWHSGLTLAQTVYTLRYVHHLADIAAPYFKVDTATWLAASQIRSPDPKRPLELVSLVLRAVVFGLLKSCDLTCRELFRDHLIDGEDWNSEKSGVMLCEHIHTDRVVQLLEEALTWLNRTSKVNADWRQALTNRLLLRKSILLTLANPISPSTSFGVFLKSLEAVRIHATTKPSIYPSQPSPIQDVFDPNISRRLVSYAPTRPVHLPPQEEVWSAMKDWLVQWVEVTSVVGAERLWSVKVLASVRAYENEKWRRIPFVRSCAITLFLDGSKILGTHEPSWITDQFFLETGGVPPSLMVDVARKTTARLSWSPGAETDDFFFLRPQVSSKPTPIEQVDAFEREFATLLVNFFTSFYHNRARQRRNLAGSLIDWHFIFEKAVDLCYQLFSPVEEWKVSLNIPLCIRYTRLCIISEVLLSGFELELYSHHEWAMIYWYLGETLSKQADIIEEIVESWPDSEQAENEREGEESDDRETHAFMRNQKRWAESLSCLAKGLRDILYHHSLSQKPIEPANEQANFEKRFKWAFVPGYSKASTLNKDRPILGEWRLWKRAHMDEDCLDGAYGNLTRAKEGLSELIDASSSECRSEYCDKTYKKLLRDHERACESNLHFLIKTKDSQDSVPHLLTWSWKSSKWFPELNDNDSA